MSTLVPWTLIEWATPRKSKVLTRTFLLYALNEIEMKTLSRELFISNHFVSWLSL